MQKVKGESPSSPYQIKQTTTTKLTPPLFTLLNNLLYLILQMYEVSDNHFAWVKTYSYENKKLETERSDKR